MENYTRQIAENTAKMSGTSTGTSTDFNGFGSVGGDGAVSNTNIDDWTKNATGGIEDASSLQQSAASLQAKNTTTAPFWFSLHYASNHFRSSFKRHHLHIYFVHT